MKSHTILDFLQHLLEQVSEIKPGIHRYLQLLLMTGGSGEKEAPLPDRRITRSQIPIATRTTTRTPDSVLTGRISKQWDRKSKSRVPKGLSNPGGYLCYRNAMLQCLVHLPEFVEYLNSIHAPWQCVEEPSKCVVCALKAFVQQYTSEERLLSSKGPKAEQRALNKALKSTIPDTHNMYEDFTKNMQSDPYDFLKYLFEKLDEVELAGDEFKLADLFKVKHKTQWTCEDCGTVHSRAEADAESGHGVGLSVNIQEPARDLSMIRYLRENDYVEKLQIRCESAECLERFGDKGDEWPVRVRRKLVTAAPEVLVVRLARFTLERNEKLKCFVEVKISDQINFEEYLNLAEFTEDEDKPLLYKLMGVVAHLGDDIAGGHYIAAVRKPEGTKFCSINDNKSTGSERQGTVEELEFPRSSEEDFDPYVLVYSKL